MSSITKTQYKDCIKKKNIALYFNYALGSPPLELHVSLIKELLSRDNKITVYICNKELKSCTPNPGNNYTVCLYCKFRALDGLKDIKNKITIKYLKLDNVSANVSERIDASLNLGAMSSMASLVKAQNYEQLNDNWNKYYNKMLYSAKQLYNYFMREIKDNKYDFIFMFNGRFGEVKPVLEAARDSSTGYGLVEVKKSLHPVVFINELVHSIEGNTRRALTAYVKDKQKAKEGAKKFFGKKVNNEDTGDPVYTKNQEAGLLPDAIVNTDKKIVAVYPTTDDEYKFIGKEWDGYVPDDQVKEIEGLSAGLDKNKYLIVVKMHPNQAHTAENIINRYMSLQQKFDHVVVEEPLSKKDTYALMRKADYIINFASTIGVEACYARKIVIAIGDTTFSRMNIAYKTKSGQEAAGLINKGDLKPKPQKGAIIWGNYLANYADTLPSYARVANGDYLVDGRKIGHSRMLRILQLPAKLRLEMNKPGFKLNIAFFLKGREIFGNVIKGKWAVK